MREEYPRVFIGYDRKLSVVYNVFSHSIISRSSRPVSISPIKLDQLDGVFDRETNPLQSTEFSFSRFLVPYMCNYEGWAIFMDNDMVMLDDISKLWDLRDDRYAVMCVHHNHVPKEQEKFLGAKQTHYEKKNWSSVMLMNCAKCKALTPEYVNTKTGLELHRFHWLENEDLIGEIPHRWNHLVDYDPELDVSEISNLHYTEGGPYFSDYKNCGYADVWFSERESMLDVQDLVKTEKKSASA